ncbi:hypothetical protein [Nesterenkonia halophila]|uniref:hypothetical protein n=1 Tax=Nesterenkonia halophila TaxID=302044 RepID=UPI0012929D42|nr:hypothetical protein [Nesterenkonia halophila]
MVLGVVGVALGTGAAGSVRRAVVDRTTVNLPDPPPADGRVGDGMPSAAEVLPGAAVVLVVVSAVLAALAIVWIVRAVPRLPPAWRLQLQYDGREGITAVSSRVIERAAERDAQQLDGVLAAHIAITGTASAPEVLAHVEVDERQDLAMVLRRSVERIGGGMAATLQTDLRAVSLVLDPACDAEPAQSVDVPQRSSARRGAPEKKTGGATAAQNQRKPGLQTSENRR